MGEGLAAVRPYLAIAAAGFRAQLSYRLSFALQALGMFLITALEFVGVVIIFSHLPHLAGWSLPEVAFLYGIAGICFALCDLAVGSLDLFPRMIREGSFRSPGKNRSSSFCYG